MEERHQTLVRNGRPSPRGRRYRSTREAKLLVSPEEVPHAARHDDMDATLMPGKKRCYHNVRHAVIRPAIRGDFPRLPQPAYIPSPIPNNEQKQMPVVAPIDKDVSEHPKFPSLAFDITSSSEEPWQKWEDMRMIMQLIEVTS